jgi:hypothetical protein
MCMMNDDAVEYFPSHRTKVMRMWSEGQERRTGVYGVNVNVRSAAEECKNRMGGIVIARASRRSVCRVRRSTSRVFV